MWHRCQTAPAPPPRVLLDAPTPTSSPKSLHTHSSPAVAVILPPKMFPSLALSVPKAGVWSLSGRRSSELVATCSANRPPIRFHCVPLRRNVRVPFPRQLLGKDSRDCPHQEGLSRWPQPRCHASHGHNPPPPSPPWVWQVPRGPRGDVALTSGFWGLSPERGEAGQAAQDRLPPSREGSWRSGPCR